jgi:hypothetical protein
MRSLQNSACMAAKAAADAGRVRSEGARLLDRAEIGWVEARNRSILVDLGLMERTGAVMAGVQGLAVGGPN